MSAVNTVEPSPLAAGPATAQRITPLSTVRHGALLTWRSLLKIQRNPEEVLGLTFMPLMFVALFVFVFGEAMMGDWQAYRDLITPGIISQSVIFATIGTGVALNSDIEKGIFDRFRSLPIARSAPLIGAILGDLVRYLLTVIMVVLVAMLIGYRPEGGVMGLVAATAVVMVFAFALCWLSAFMGLLLRTPMAVNIFGSIWMFPLTFASSAFVPTDRMPGFMQTFAELNPVTHVIDAMRALLEGQPAGEPLLWVAGWSVLITAVFFPLATRAYRRRA
ncbi:ABC transporter permease [Streptomonospora nanhaiensis]|uniref:Transport permease protein n=1 Tax=Streptomonospora nanhaiensis TaxID=1323731 RepID=A0A853BGG7_9ACTN|nr:ABC transporter permease [Streptomonospora nanhaiensis]MBV2366254.1 ABC transporter permease [Streptomonospora nanhaiensis]MBX9391100.1 ABC transporter permease [Streptomonospora nanhaiensis]NYI93824.1 oleandomycin transport system permease protein [Streptomonospora nanhaiensis]